MSMFTNGVGRPSNETIRKRNIFKGICVLLILVIIGLVGYILNDKGIINLGNKNTKDGNEKVATTTKAEDNKSYSPKEAFDKFVKDNHLITYVDDEKHSDDDKAAFDMKALKKDNCTTATMARPDGSVDVYYAEIFTFTDENSSKKYAKGQVEYQKEDSSAVQTFEKKILTDKSTDDYDMFELKQVVEDIDDSNSKDYEYYYSVRIGNYYITLHTVDTLGDMTDEMINLKNDLNTLLGIK